MQSKRALFENALENGNVAVADVAFPLEAEAALSGLEQYRQHVGRDGRGRIARTTIVGDANDHNARNLTPAQACHCPSGKVRAISVLFEAGRVPHVDRKLGVSHAHSGHGESERATHVDPIARRSLHNVHRESRRNALLVDGHSAPTSALNHHHGKGQRRHGHADSNQKSLLHRNLSPLDLDWGN